MILRGRTEGCARWPSASCARGADAGAPARTRRDLRGQGRARRGSSGANPAPREEKKKIRVKKRGPRGWQECGARVSRSPDPQKGEPG